MLPFSPDLGLDGPGSERRDHGRASAYGVPLIAPSGASLVDCSRRGAGVETDEPLPVGSLAELEVVLPEGEIKLLGRVCWSGPVGEETGARAAFRAGLDFVPGQSFGIWKGLVQDLGAPSGPDTRLRPGRRVVKWRPTPASSSK